MAAPKQDVSNRPRFHTNHKPNGPSPEANNITPGDEFLKHPATINVGVAGNITIVDLEGNEVYYENYIGRIPVYTVKVLANSATYGNTTASNIVAEF